MISTHDITTGLTVLAGISGLISAYFWWRSARVNCDPPADLDPQLHYVADKDYGATITALREIGQLNKAAAGWSAVTAVLTTAAALI